MVCVESQNCALFVVNVDYRLRMFCAPTYLLLDQGRLLRVTAGFENILPEKIASKSAKKSASNTAIRSALFDMIEDIEEKTIDTPLSVQNHRYAIVSSKPSIRHCQFKTIDTPLSV